jgi:aminopeptidase-like protein
METPEFRRERMMRLLREISPLQRMINSPGLDRTFEIVRRELPGTVIHEYPVGLACGDWEVPRGWSVTTGEMRSEAGELVASIAECPLFVAPYSEPVDGWFTKEEIRPHLRTRPDRPDAFALEHRNAYNPALNDWGVTLPHNRWEALPEGRYHVRIEVAWHHTSMKVAELVIPGRRRETVCVCGHIDELCNDDLSGCILAMEMMQGLLQRGTLELTWQMLLVPEMFGPMYFMQANPGRIADTVGMLNLETVGAGEQWCLKRALRHGERFERLLAGALREQGAAYRELSFFEGYGNDERVYAWPTFDIPGVALQRFPFERYHTSEDTPEGIDPALMLEALAVCESFADLAERDYRPRWTGLFQPWLTKRGLYFDNAERPEDFQKFNNLVLFNIDGERSVSELAELAGLEFRPTWEYLERFAQDGLLEKRPATWARG